MGIQNNWHYFFIVLFLNISINLSAQIPIHWNMNKTNGLPTNTIYKIIQDNNGIIWIGTSAGLVKHNSLEAVTFSNNDLVDNDFITINLDSLNRVWVTNVSKQISFFDNIN